MKKTILLAIFFALFSVTSFSQTKIKRAVFQAFWWNYWNNNYPYSWANYLTELAPRLKAAGFDAVWIPPSTKNSSPGSVGYAPFDQYDLGDKYQQGGYLNSSNVLQPNVVPTRSGTKDELLRMIAVMHANGLEVIEDVVLSHMNSAGSSTGAGGQDAYANSNYSDGNSAGYKNFRYVSYATPALDESANDYWSRTGRWPKNYENFFPNASYVANTNDYNSIVFGPQIDYDGPAFGQSTSMTHGNNVTIGSITRKLYNPAQSYNYMYSGARDALAWFKKQTGADGWRWDAAKNIYPWMIQAATSYTKLNSGFANGGQNMFCVGEYVDNGGNIDNFISSIVNYNKNLTGATDQILGAFDFGLRGYGFNSNNNSGGIFGMVLGQGGYNMASLPGEQQYNRYQDYNDGTRVHRTVPFVNNHDTFRPNLDASGNYASLGSGSWSAGGELGGNGTHLDPREPRIAAAYAAICAMDGNPTFFFEDVFDIGTTGKRWTHKPTNTSDLPLRGDIINVLQAHQALGFKNGDYGVSTAQSGGSAPFYSTGNSGDHLVIERNNKVIIGITDAYSSVNTNSADQIVWITTNFAVGTVLYDYSGAHGVTSSVVQNGNRVSIQTAPNGHTIPNAYGHGYSIWAPYPSGTPSTVNDLYNYLANHITQYRSSTTTTQEWEMADDLGDSHCSSLGQGGALPTNSKNQRVAGKIFVASGTNITYKVSPATDNTNITAALWDLDGNKLSEISGNTTAASPITGNYTALADGWVTIKVHNTTASQATQTCWVNVTYTAPAVVNTLAAANATATRAAIWTGNKGTTDITDCGNWEEGIIPSASSNLVIPANSSPAPIINADLHVKNLILESNATATINSGVKLYIGGTINNNSTGSLSASNATIVLEGSSAQTIPAGLFASNTIQNLTINNAAGVTLNGALTVTGIVTPSAGTLTTNGNLTLASTVSSTASIAQGSGSYLSGNVKVQRYVGNTQIWRMVGFPFTAVTNIAQSTLSGFYTSGYNAYTYNEAADDGKYGNSGASNAGWVQFTGGNISSSKGLLLSGGVIPSVINFSGPVNTGTQNIALSYSSGNTNKGWNLIANPFASNINWTSIIAANPSGLTNAIYRYDPNTTGYAAYVNGVNAGNQSNVIENGASIFVKSTGATNLTIQESDKTSNGPLASLFGVEPVTAQQKSIIKLSLAKQGDVYGDEVVVRWGIDPATDNFDGPYDAYDMGRTTGPDLSVIGKDGTVYSIFHGSALQSKDKEQRDVLLGIKNMEEGNYTINTHLLSSVYNNNDVYLIDHFNNQVTLVSTDSSSYSFMVTSNQLSALSNRFSLAINHKPTVDIANNGILLLNNPSTNNQFNIVIGSDYQKVDWQLVDNNGRMLQSGVFNGVKKGVVNIAQTHLTTTGNYYIKLIADGNTLPSQKWIKQ